MPSVDEYKRKIEKTINSMTGLSPTAQKVVKIANDINSSPNDLVNVIKLDPLLTSKVLKLINSAFYGLPTKISSPGKAVILLGLNTVKNLALSMAVIGKLSTSDSQDKYLEEIWLHSLSTAVGSRELAKAIRMSKKDYEDFFISGLLHDIGKIIMIMSVGAEFVNFLNEEKFQDLTNIEKETVYFGTNHCKIGNSLANKWQFPQELADAILYHHEPRDVEESTIIEKLVLISDRMSNKLGYSLQAGALETDVPREILEKINLTIEQVETVFENVPEELEKAKVFLQN